MHTLNLLNFLVDYIDYLLGLVLQFMFIFLPINLKNWDDDLLNCLTYVLFQVFVAAFLFIVCPWVLGFKSITTWTQVCLVLGTGFFALGRILFLIPLEFTYPVPIPQTTKISFEFSDFRTLERYGKLYDLDFQEADAFTHYCSLREKLVRIKLEDNPDKDDLD